MGISEAHWQRFLQQARNQERICPVCGKKFYPTPGWVYKDTKRCYCSWTCLREYEKHPNKYKSNKKRNRKST